MVFVSLLQLSQRKRDNKPGCVWGFEVRMLTKNKTLFLMLNGGNINFNALISTDNSSRTSDVIWILFSIFIN